MKSPSPVKNHAPVPSRPRGRPRSAQARRAILDAARELLAQDGLAAVTIEGIAARAGVGKPTIYRSWPNAQAVAMAALMEATAPGEAAAAGGPKQVSSLAALQAQLHEVVRVFSAPLGRSVAVMLASAEQDTELSKVFRNHFILARRAEGRAFLQKASEQGEIRSDFPLEVALDLIYAPIFYRLLMGHAPLDAQFTDAILALALRGLHNAPADRRRGAAR